MAKAVTFEGALNTKRGIKTALQKTDSSKLFSPALGIHLKGLKGGDYNSSFNNAALDGSDIFIDTGIGGNSRGTDSTTGLAGSGGKLTLRASGGGENNAGVTNLSTTIFWGEPGIYEGELLTYTSGSLSGTGAVFRVLTVTHIMELQFVTPFSIREVKGGSGYQANEILLFTSSNTQKTIYIKVLSVLGGGAIGNVQPVNNPLASSPATKEDDQLHGGGTWSIVYADGYVSSITSNSITASNYSSGNYYSLSDNNGSYVYFSISFSSKPTDSDALGGNGGNIVIESGAGGSGYTGGIGGSISLTCSSGGEGGSGSNGQNGSFSIITVNQSVYSTRLAIDTNAINFSGTSNTALTIDASGNITKIGQSTHTDGYFLKWDNSNGKAVWDTADGTITALNNQTANRLVTIGSTTTELDGEENLTFDGSTLGVTGAVTASSIVTCSNLTITPFTETSSTTNLTITIDFSSTNGDFIYTLQTGVSTVTLAASSINSRAIGSQGTIIIKTPPSGTPTLTWDSTGYWYFESGSEPSLSSDNDVYDVFNYYIVATNAAAASCVILITSASSFSQPAP